MSETDTVKVKCSGCGEPIELSWDQVGKKLECVECSTRIDWKAYQAVTDELRQRRATEKESQKARRAAEKEARNAEYRESIAKLERKEAKRQRAVAQLDLEPAGQREQTPATQRQPVAAVDQGSPGSVPLNIPAAAAIRLGFLIGIGLSCWAVLVWIIMRTCNMLSAEQALRAKWG